jgi:two-component system, OmpR family, KDP operon response regulator KdpE
MDDSDPFATPHQTATLNRPLLGLTIMVVEDSRFACEAMRLLCLRSGARIRRADCLRSARRHLQVYRPSVAVIDLGLPDGSGIDLIEEMSAATPRAAVILGTSGDDFAENMAIAAGADGFLAKPLTSLATFQEAVLSRLPAERHPSGLRIITDETIKPDPMAYQDDMAHMAEMLNTGVDDKTLDYVAQFISGVARSADDSVLAQAAVDLARARADGTPLASNAARIAGLVQDRLHHKMVV